MLVSLRKALAAFLRPFPVKNFSMAGNREEGTTTVVVIVEGCVIVLEVLPKKEGKPGK